MKKLLYLSMLLLFVLTGCTEEKKEFTVYSGIFGKKEP